MVVTDAERRLLGLLAQGKTQRQTAIALSVSEHTVRRMLDAVCARAGVATTVEVVVLAVRSNLI